MYHVHKVIKHWGALIFILPSYALATEVEGLNISSIGQKEKELELKELKELKEKMLSLETKDIGNNQLVDVFNALIEKAEVEAKVESVEVNMPEAIADQHNVDTDSEEVIPSTNLVDVRRNFK